MGKKIVWLICRPRRLLGKKSKDKGNAIILAVLCIVSPLNLVFAVSFIASSHRKGKRKWWEFEPKLWKPPDLSYKLIFLKKKFLYITNVVQSD